MGTSGFFSLFFQSYLGFFGAVGAVISSGGWVVFLLFFFAMLFKLYMEIIRRKYVGSLQWVFLRVRVPEGNLRTPRSMEEVLNGLHGLQKPPDLMELYLDGYVQAWYSLEIRGTPEGVSFVLRVPAGNRDFAEAAVYAQYPDAEIDEVADYAAPYILDRLEKEFDVWGSEMVLVKEDAYPIKTYIDFEDEFAEEGRLVDPMATITEFFSALKPGEEMWVQVLIRPALRDDWQKAGMRLALKLAGREPPKEPTRIGKAFQLLGRAVTVAATLAPAPGAEEREEGLNLGVLRLTPGETDIVRGIQRNVSKVAYEAKVRLLYVAPLAVYQRRARIPMMFGMFRQFSDLNLNSFRPDGRFTTSKPVYSFVRARQRYRKRKLLRKYRQRYFREKGFVLNVEEVATLYHPPVEYVKTPVLERARAKKGEAPANVPLAPEELPLA